ncbi:DUF1501 domain-containing protein [Vibrio lamellibrachiae]|uniref:DUF1501 domain-containing protein n=1 Tax=Vibrio lamellibrachiae TaxID=2910253 RepID=UPI003D0A8063
MQVSRRLFLKGSASTAGIAALNLSSPMAHAFSESCDNDMAHKALVGINLGGGNDGFNCFIPKNDTEYNEYKALRGSLAFENNEVSCLKLLGDDAKLGLSPELNDLKWLFDDGLALPVVNVGPLTQERKPDTHIDDLKPIHIFSHNHQSTITQTNTRETIGNQGWGGLSAYILDNSYGLKELPPLFEVGSQTVWTNSLPKSANRIGTSLPPAMSLEEHGAELYAGFRRSHATKDSLFKKYYAEMCDEAKNNFDEFGQIFDEGDDYGFNVETSIGRQLKTVLLLLDSRDKFDHPVQFFSVTLGGFDTHASQKEDQGALLRLLASQVSNFYCELKSRGLMDSVTTFTFSEFGRTLEPNGSGTDHGWGNCQMVLGGDVLGDRVLGEWPNLAEGSKDLMTRGRVVPTMSVDLFHASLLNWVGIKESCLEHLFPSLKEFDQKALPIFRSCDNGNDTKLEIIGATASAENPNGIDKISHGYDKDMSTKWSAKGQGVTYTVELESLSTVHSVRFAQMKGQERSYRLDIETSQDGYTFDALLSIRTEGKSDEMVAYPLGSLKARFVRFVCNGNSDSDESLKDWTNFRNIEVLGR